MTIHKTIPVALVLLVALATTAPAAEPVTVVIEGHGSPLKGFLRSISDSRFLLQSEDAYYEFTRGQILSVDGSDAIPTAAYGERPLIWSSYYEVVGPGGEVEVHHQLEFTNRSSRFVTSTSWGVGDEEEEMHASMAAHDGWGNELEIEVRTDGGRRQAVLRFAVPVAPGETSTFALSFVRRGAARRDGDIWSYTFNVDFPEDRYFIRKVALPAGAELVETYSGSRELEVGGRSLLVSQRYYPARTVDPLTVRYRLP
ncbi:MAG: hypothetical protein GY838_14600 [bacterium]|nr:hypothetical protein [bacterium]